ncbi:MAG: SOS-response repressor and protease LexA [Candidatus Carbobacillus altaicus]|uniref:LexA repressor n=1 Tax=Candidatus Carbonibacillus altaicus TaxID=2163959 RepID=A0A2R6Y3G6_9BACL|nr:MAG: SOS-response repressor and protease LexA [Candidatus Carbobacillus altaicus]
MPQTIVALSKRQLDILQAIYESMEEQGYPPSVREICALAHIPSTSTAHNELKKLNKSGFIHLEQEKTRALRLTEKGLQALREEGLLMSGRGHHPLFDERNAPHIMERSKVRYAPIVGKVTAGVPITAVEHIEDYYPLPEHTFSGGDIFLLRVEGDSMIGAAILEGDLVLVRKQPSAEQGDIVVAMTPDGEATVKRLYWRERTFHLVAENPAYPTLILPEVTILGKVIGLIRDYEQVVL